MLQTCGSQTQHRSVPVVEPAWSQSHEPIYLAASFFGPYGPCPHLDAECTGQAGHALQPTPEPAVKTMVVLQCAVITALTLMLWACAATDPALRQAIAEVADRPQSARIKLRPFAEQGNETAITQICVAYGRSMDFRVRDAERAQAFAWCAHAARAGHVEAQYHLGMFYKSGIGTAEDKAAALQWYRQAAALGHDEAENEARGLEGRARLCKNWITQCRMF